MRFGILGPLEVTDGNQDLLPGRSKQRTLLAALLVDANEVVSTDQLTSLLWPSSSKDRLNYLQTLVSRIRVVIERGGGVDSRRLARHGRGYVLRVGNDELDALTFESLSCRAYEALAAGDWRSAHSAAELALQCWRGRALDEFCDEEFAKSRATKLEAVRLLTVECSLEARLALGQHRELTGHLEELVLEHPLRESLWARLMLALYRSGRQSDALRAFDRIRGILAVELGITPGAELTKLQQAVLDHDPTLDEWGVEPASRLRAAVPAASQNRIPRGDSILERDEAQTTVPHNLPRHLTSLVGRQAERARLADALGRSRFITLVGTGGCGKTRLAIAVAEDALTQFSDGVCFVDFSPFTESRLADRAITAALGVETGGADQLEDACRHIGGKKLLLVLDNCEHLIDAVALGAKEILVRCPGTRVLATSREEFRVDGEIVWRVPPLSLPPCDVAIDSELLMDSEAVQLFIQRGRSVLTDFAPSGHMLTKVVHVCRRLDGIPLAIELAAALIASVPVANLAERLDDRFRLLSKGPRHTIERQRTLRATLDWSFELLDEHTRDLFVRLAVFPSDFTLVAAEAIAYNDPSGVARGLRNLVATSMITCVADSEGAARYHMLETVRHYARQRLEELDIADEMRSRHASYYADFAEDAQRHAVDPAADWVARVVSALPNLRAAVAWAIEHDDASTGLRLVGSLRWYLDRIGMLPEAARWLDGWVSRLSDLPQELRLRVLIAACNVAFMQGDFSRTRRLGEEAVTLARDLEDDHQLEYALIGRGSAALYEGDPGRAVECFEEAEPLCIRLGDRWGMAWNLTVWAISSRRKGEPNLARRQLVDALNIFRSVNDRHGQVLPLVYLALLAQDEGQMDRSLALANDALDASSDVGDPRLQHIALCYLGRIELFFGHLRRARAFILRSLSGLVGSDSRFMIAVAIEGLAGLAELGGCHRDSVELLGFTEWMGDHWKFALSPMRVAERADWLQRAERVIGTQEVNLALDRGRRMNQADAFQRARVATVAFACQESSEQMRTDQNCHCASLPPTFVAQSCTALTT